MTMKSSLTLAVGVLLTSGAALWGQAAPGNVTVSAAGADGPNLVRMAAGGAGGGFKTFAFLSGELSGNPVKGQPYSAQASTETTQTLADGNQITRTTNANVYRDAEGRERREQTISNLGGYASQDPPMQIIFISDPVAGVNYSLNSNDHVAMKMPAPQPDSVGGAQIRRGNFSEGAGTASIRTTAIPPPGIAMMDAGPAVMAGGPFVMAYRTGSATSENPPVTEKLGTQTIQGVQAEGMRTTFTIPAGQIGNLMPIQVVDEVWRSPDLQVIVKSTHSDPRMGTTTYTLNNISRSDPSPTLFQVPADYTIKDAESMKIQLDKKQSLQVQGPQE